MTILSRVILWWMKRNEDQACLILENFETWQLSRLARDDGWLRGIVRQAVALRSPEIFDRDAIPGGRE